VLGIPERDRSLMQSRVSPDPAYTTRRRAGKRVTVLNAKGSRREETVIPSAIIIATPYSSIGSPQRNLNNASNRHLQSKDDSMDVDENVTTPMQTPKMQNQIMALPQLPEMIGVNRNLNAECQCGGDGKKNISDKATDIIPARRRPHPVITDADDCPPGEAKWNWHVDASWGCDCYPETIYCDDKCPSFLEYLLCPESDECEPDEHELSNFELVDLDVKVVFRQGETEPNEIRNLEIEKIGKEDLKVTWAHPPGSHPVYVVVVYPPAPEKRQKATGPCAGPCADDDDCFCGADPIFRKHLSGTATEIVLSTDMLDPDQTYIIEVATLTADRNESLGTSLIICEVYDI